jgi:hypothetical protein
MESERGQYPIIDENWCDPHAPNLPLPIRIADGSIALAYFAGNTNASLLCFPLRDDSIAVHELKTAKEIESEIKDYLLTGNSAARLEISECPFANLPEKRSGRWAGSNCRKDE